MESKSILFIAEKGALQYAIPGGVQVCTHELIDYLELANFTVIKFPVATTRSFVRRLKIKLGIDTYDLFDYEQIAVEVAKKINDDKLTIVALNQIYFAPLVPLVKALVHHAIQFIGLSHGNESGDFLHEASKHISPLKTWKLGRLLIKERIFYKEYLDKVIVITEHEVGLNQWLGADKLFILPRRLTKSFIDWQPQKNKVGFVGTLNHLPNLEGIELLAKELDDLSFDGVFSVVGGPANTGHKLEEKFKCIHYKGKLDALSLEKEIASWSVFLNPVFWYSRGSSTKLAQGLNWGLPVLSTPAGRRGYLLSDERIIVKDHQPITFANAIIEACKTPLSLSEIKKATEKNVEDFNTKEVVFRLQQFLTH